MNAPAFHTWEAAQRYADQLATTTGARHRVFRVSWWLWRVVSA